jgi:hypothetical protein
MGVRWGVQAVRCAFPGCSRSAALNFGLKKGAAELLSDEPWAQRAWGSRGGQCGGGGEAGAGVQGAIAKQGGRRGGEWLGCRKLAGASPASSHLSHRSALQFSPGPKPILLFVSTKM